MFNAVGVSFSRLLCCHRTEQVQFVCVCPRSVRWYDRSLAHSLARSLRVQVQASGARARRSVSGDELENLAELRSQFQHCAPLQSQSIGPQESANESTRYECLSVHVRAPDWLRSLHLRVQMCSGASLRWRAWLKECDCFSPTIHVSLQVHCSCICTT